MPRIDTKFVVHNKDELIKYLLPQSKNAGGQLGAACEEAADALLRHLKKVKENQDYIPSFSLVAKDNINRNIGNTKGKRIEFTVGVLCSLVNLFFVQKNNLNQFLSEPHDIEDLRGFFSCIDEIKNRNQKDREKFNTFIAYEIDSIREYLAEPFGDYDYELTEEWEFSCIPINNDSKDEVEIAKTPDIIKENDESSHSNEDIGSDPKEEDPKRPWYKKKGIVLGGLGGLVVMIGFAMWWFFPTTHEPIFEAVNPYYKILILPFENDCPMASTLDTADKNAVLKRLRELNSRDSLGLDIRFHENYIPEEMKAGQSNYDYYNEIIEKNNADHIIFGSILSAECSNSGKDELALSYHINQRNNINNQESIFKYTLYHSPVSFSEILNGRQLEDIEYTIYLNIALSFFNQHKFHHADYYMRYLLSNAERFNDEDIFNIKLIRFFIFNFYYINNPSGVEEQKLNENILDYCPQFFEYRNKEYYTYEIDLYCRFSLDLIETDSVSQELQAEIEQRIESNDLNATTLFVYKLFFLLVDIEDYLYKNDVHDTEKIDQVYALIDKYMSEFSESRHGLLLLENFLRAFEELEFPSSEKLIDYVNIILKEKPNHYDFLTIRAGLYREMNEYDKALKDFTLLHERHPDSLDVNFEIIETYQKMENDDQAHQMAMKSMTLLSESQDARYYLFFNIEPLIDYFFERKQYRYAIDLIDIVVKNTNLDHVTKHELVEKGFEANVHGKNYREIIYFEAKLFELNLIITNKIYGPENDSETLDFKYLGPDIQNPNIDTSGLLEIK